ncbi:hypothetical protein HMN09_00371600 [Mycena chlorophos]|uniref:F-box domain-containing protein n=1 Tax=Mycena chlorophos TaxID=658473 RepID=A0A8H6TKZ7_MYCCL|nr:hypothetical protein HMN09_00371600 [Mycena chlorophos]
MNPLSIPPELWAEIFKEVDYWSTLRLTAVMATCRTFAHVARPLHLATCYFAPHGLKSSLGEPLKLCVLASPAEEQKTIARLDFWTSEAVAPAVRHCVVTTWPAEAQPTGYGVVIDDTTVPPLLDLFIGRLHRLSQLRSLVLQNVLLTGPLVASIYRDLPHLEELSIQVWTQQTPISFSCPDLGSGPRIAKFSITTDEFRPRPVTNQLLAPWVSLLSPTHLQEIKLDSRMHDWRINDIPVLSSVKTVEVDIRRPGTDAENVLALSQKFPSVRNLSLATASRFSEDMGAACDALLRHATKLRIGHQALPFCLPRTQNLLELDVNSSPAAADLVAHLNSSHFSTITTFLCDFWVKRAAPPSTGDLAAILGCFPQLRHLNMWFRAPSNHDDGRVSIGVLNSLMSAAFPPTITTIVVFASRLGGERTPLSLPPELRGLLPEPTVIRDSIIRQNPLLTTLWVQAGPILIVWRPRTSASGGVVADSICTENPEQGQYPTRFHWWDTRAQDD